MGFWSRSKAARAPMGDEEPEYLSYGPLYDPEGPSDPEFGAWLDDEVGLDPDEDASKEHPKTRTRWWWIKRGLLGFAVVFVLLVAWLAITAPLSKSLQPIAPPQITLLAADGT